MVYLCWFLKFSYFLFPSISFLFARALLEIVLSLHSSLPSNKLSQYWSLSTPSPYVDQEKPNSLIFLLYFKSWTTYAAYTNLTNLYKTRWYFTHDLSWLFNMCLFSTLHFDVLVYNEQVSKDGSPTWNEIMAHAFTRYSMWL